MVKPFSVFLFVMFGHCALYAQKTSCDTMYTLPQTFNVQKMTDSTRFRPEFVHGDPMTYSFEIRDRWGQQVFVTDIPEQGWNGRRVNRGEAVAEGTYMWIMSFTTYDSLQVNCSGFVTCIETYPEAKITGLDTLQCRPYVWVPNVFTPNGDGANDVFMPLFGCPPFEYTMFIYDRWGELVFTTTDVNKGWDAYKANGELASTDVYVWRIKCRFYAGDRQREYTGHVTVIR